MGSIPQQNLKSNSQLYGPNLKEGYIRLVRLLPSKISDGPIRCNLFEVSFDDFPRWEALSYMWGEANCEKTITINGIETPIRKTLWDCLSHLRGANERVLWIDAICINQENIIERNHQVKQMKRIYESASRVIIWLGLRSNSSDLAISFIKAIGQNPKLDHSNMVQELQAMKELIARPYWKRLWIIQEVAVASRIRIQCGTAYTTWKHFSAFREEFLFGNSPCCNNNGTGLLLHKDFGRSQTEFADCYTVFWLDEMHTSYHGDGSRLLILLEMSEGFQCSDVRDKVYGLAGLATDGASVVIDYSRSPSDLFIDLILREDSTRIPMLGHARFLQRTLLGEVKTPPIECCYSSTTSVVAGVYEAGIIGSLGPIPDWDRVDFVHPYSIEHLEVMKLEAYDSLTVMSISSGIAYAVKENETSQVNTSVVNGMEGMTPESRSEHASKTDNKYAATLVETDSSTPMQQETRPLLFADQKGRIGIAPSNVRIGDTICRIEEGLWHGSVAVILRKMGPFYSIIGRATFPYPVGQFKAKYGNRINLHLDIRTLQLLTIESRTC